MRRIPPGLASFLHRIPSARIGRLQIKAYVSVRNSGVVQSDAFDPISRPRVDDPGRDPDDLVFATLERVRQRFG